MNSRSFIGGLKSCVGAALAGLTLYCGGCTNDVSSHPCAGSYVGLVDGFAVLEGRFDGQEFSGAFVSTRTGSPIEVSLAGTVAENGHIEGITIEGVSIEGVMDFDDCTAGGAYAGQGFLGVWTAAKED